MPTNPDTPSNTVAAIMLGAMDSGGLRVIEMYAKRVPFYAVYRTDQRVVVQYADDAPTQDQQRHALAKIGQLRIEVANLIEGWRRSRRSALQAKAKAYDRRVGDALVCCLESDVDSAQQSLKDTRDEINGERTSWARFIYLIVASSTCCCAIALFWLLSSPFVRRYASLPEDSDYLLLLAAGAGTVGAFFSVAIAITGRTILTDLRTRDNAADAILRVVIGAIAAAVLLGLILTKMVDFQFGGRAFDKSLVSIMLIGFAAGFSERLVPDLLKQATAKVVGVPPPNPPAGGAAANSAAAITGNANNGPSADSSPPAPDGCDAMHGVSDAEATADKDLPPATGGVA
jgi:hypothetical protein